MSINLQVDQIHRVRKDSIWQTLQCVVAQISALWAKNKKIKERRKKKEDGSE
jgi:hypothetical protein